MLCFGRSALWLKRGTACSLSVILPCGVGGIDQLESFDFRRREILHKNVEIFAEGKIAEFARFAGGERRKSPDRFSFNSSDSELWMGGGLSFCWSAAERNGDRMTIV